MLLGEAFTGSVLTGQMGQLLVQCGWIVQHVDAGVQTVDDTHAMSLELGAVWVVNIHASEQGAGFGEAIEQAGIKQKHRYIIEQAGMKQKHRYIIVFYSSVNGDLDWSQRSARDGCTASD